MTQRFQRSKVIFEDDCIRLHQFSSKSGRAAFVVPPHAGRAPTVTQNLIDRLVTYGKTVYAYELLEATPKTGGLTVQGLVNYLKKCRSFMGEPAVELLGVCQGGWLSAVYTALHPEDVHRLALFAAPINTQTGEDNVIEKYCKTMNMAWHRFVVSINGGVQPGLLQWMSFAMAKPVPVFYTRYQDQCLNILADDSKAYEKQRRNDSWYDSPKDLHGGWFLEAMANHFKENRLYNGTWDLGGIVVPQLSDITCPVYVYAGQDDDITHWRQAKGLLDKVSSKEKHFHNFEGAGHTAVFARPACIDHFIREFYVR